MASVKQYKVTPLKFDAKLVEKVMRKRTDGDSIAVIAKALKLSAGKAAMAELIGTTERITIDDPAKLARAIVKDRRSGRSWGWLAARYGVTEGTCRAAYEAATGQPFTAIDYRKAAGGALDKLGEQLRTEEQQSARTAKPARKATAAGAKRDRGIATGGDVDAA